MTLTPPPIFAPGDKTYNNIKFLTLLIVPFFVFYPFFKKNENNSLCSGADIWGGGTGAPPPGALREGPGWTTIWLIA